MSPTLEAYIAEHPGRRQDRLRELIAEIHGCCPEATVRMGEVGPTFELAGNWISLASERKTLTLWACCLEPVSEFRNRHPEIKGGKGCLSFKDSNKLHLKDLKQVIRKSLQDQGPPS